MTEKADGKLPATMVDHMSSHYLSASDYPHQIHVNESLTDQNYMEWQQAMYNFLYAKNKDGFVDGTLPMPKDGDGYQILWKRVDAMIRGWLMAAMEKNIRTSVSYATSSHQIWKDLMDRFGKQCAPRLYEFCCILSTIRQEGETVSAYYTKLRTVWDEINSVSLVSVCACDEGKRNQEARERDHLYDFLLGLDDEFNVVRTQILATVPPPTLSIAYHLVAEYERQQAITSSRRVQQDAAAFGVQFSSLWNHPKTLAEPRRNKSKSIQFNES